MLRCLLGDFDFPAMQKAQPILGTQMNKKQKKGDGIKSLGEQYICITNWPTKLFAGRSKGLEKNSSVDLYSIHFWG